MLYPGVFMTDTENNLGTALPASSENVCGIVFDISQQTGFWTTGYAANVAANLQNKVLEFNSMNDVNAAGIIPYNGQVDGDNETKDLLYGIPYYHIKHFFKVIGSSGRLFVAFADCSSNWNILRDMQVAANGLIYQFGVWTEQNLWSKMDASATSYSLNLVSDLNSMAVSLATDYHAPVSILLNANTAKVKTATTPLTTVTMSSIPTCVSTYRYVSVLLGQAIDGDVHKMQTKLASLTPVGNVGAALGCLAIASVDQNIGWVNKFDMAAYFPDIEFGFGTATVASGATEIANATPYASLTSQQLATLQSNGYIFLLKYAGLEGHSYFSGDQTCSNADFRRIAYNRAINKSRRGVRTALLPDVNSSVYVDPSSGQLSASQITYYSNKVKAVLNAMVSAGEISGIGSITIDPSQNILVNDKLEIKYSIVPVGTASQIDVTEGLALSQS